MCFIRSCDGCSVSILVCVRKCESHIIAQLCDMWSEVVETMTFTSLHNRDVLHTAALHVKEIQALVLIVAHLTALFVTPSLMLPLPRRL